MIRLLYSTAIYLLSPVFMLYLLWRSRRAPSYRQRWAERFGFYKTDACPSSIWIHAVSVGEVQAATPLIKHLHDTHPGTNIVITTTTPTGSAQVQETWGDSVIHVYAPYDMPDAINRFLRAMRPTLAIFMETEIWPNILYACTRHNIPTVLANARMSQRSASGYRKLGGFMRQTMARIDAVAAQSQDDAARLIGLGVRTEAVHITGSIKFDIQLAASLQEEAAVLRRDWGVERSVWIAASTRLGEDELILSAFAMVKHARPEALLVIVPRHPERFDSVASLCEKRGFNLVRRSAHQVCDKEVDIYLGDSMGELTLFYAASDIAFIGGSLVPTGGQNPIEAAALGLPILIGPHCYNFVDVTRLLREQDAAVEVSDYEQLASIVIDYCRQPNLRHSRGEHARAVVERNRGAVNRLINVIQDCATQS